MFCKKCGAEIVDGSAFCTHCGESQIDNDTSAPWDSPISEEPFVEPSTVSQTIPEQEDSSYQSPYATPETSRANVGGDRPPRPNSWLGWNIFSLICCCLPLGIAGVIFSSQVNSKYDMGDYMGAQKSADTARTLFIVSIILGIVLYIVFALIGFSSMALIAENGLAY